jgi:hypothetical protein
MAKKNLDLLLNDFAADVLREGLDPNIRATDSRKVVNTLAHIYEINLKELQDEVTNQVAGTYSTKAATRVEINTYRQTVINKACEKYFKSVVSEMKKPRKGFNTEILINTPTHFSVRIEGSGNSSVFSTFIDRARSLPLKQLRDSLSIDLLLEEDESVNSRIQGYMKNDVRIGGLLDIGHQEGFSIADKRVQNLLEKLELKVKATSKRQTKTESPLLRILAEVKTNPRVQVLKEISFKAEVRVREQGVDSNRRVQSKQEFQLINSIKKQFKALIEKEDWGNFSTSPSAIDITRGSILESARKAGFKVKKTNSETKKKSGYTTSKQVKKSTTVTKEKDSGVKVSRKSGNRNQPERPQTRNWLQLLPMINSRLTDIVAKNMNSPRLNFRTGRFAQSARVVNVEQTPQGFPSFVFDYERNPYDVFDRTKGRSPWNTPQRDPRALVDVSVRQIVREMAIGRFFTRRA